VIPNAIDVTGGNGGNGGTGSGTGKGGAGGSSGGPGAVYLINAATGVVTSVLPGTGTLGGTTSTSTAGVGTTATTTQQAL
jgi:hypothetical protein